MLTKLDPALIRDLPPFSGMTLDQMTTLRAKATPLRADKGSHIFDMGAEARSFFLLLDGYIRVVRTTPNGEQVIARYIASGELFGIAEALGMKQYPASAVAAVDCVALSWPSDIWHATAAAHPAFATNKYKTIGGRLQDAQDRLVEMATERVEQRVASAILNLVERSGRQTDDGILIDFPISRQDISEMTGTTLHTVSRLMSGWENDGLVKSGRQKITVIGSEGLSLIANKEGSSQ